MLNALWISATGMTAQQLNMDTISNNLANVNTTAYKASRAQFADIFYQKTENESEAGPAQVQGPAVGLGTHNTAISRHYTQGTLEATGNPLDLAISGDGFFQVTRTDGSVGYTRDGSFKVNSEGMLVTAQGMPLLPQIQVPSDTMEVSVAADGTVSVKTSRDSSERVVGQLELCRFVNPDGLKSEGQNLLTATSSSGEPLVNAPGQDGLGTLTQGSLERSNVNLVNEMVNMIMTQRAYEVNSKAVSASDEMLRMANNLHA